MTTSSLAKSRSCAKRGRGGVADRQALAVSRDEIGIGTRTPEVVPFQVKTTSRSKSTVDEIGKLAVIGIELADIRELQLLDDIGDPAGAEAFPGDHVDAARAEQRPERHFDGAGVGGRHDADAVIGRHFENFTGKVDGLLELALADLRAVRAAEGRVGERIERPTGALRAGARRKMGICGRMSGFAGFAMMLSFQIESPSLGRGVPPPCVWIRRVIVKIEVSRGEHILTQSGRAAIRKAALLGRLLM